MQCNTASSITTVSDADARQLRASRLLRAVVNRLWKAREFEVAGKFLSAYIVPRLDEQNAPRGAPIAASWTALVRIALIGGEYGEYANAGGCSVTRGDRDLDLSA